MAHRLALEFAGIEVPDSVQVDHVCWNRNCVRPEHLRFVNNKQNNENPSRVRKDNSYGYRGVGFSRRTGKYRARVTHNGREVYGGEYTTAQEAAEAAKGLRLQLFTHNELDRTA